MEKDITRLFCLIDDFLKALEKEEKKKQDRVHRYLMARGLKIITEVKRSMKNILMSFEGKFFVQTLSRRDGFRQPQKQIHARTLPA